MRKIKTKINKWDLIKLKSFCKANYKQCENRQPSEWEKIITNEATDKWLIFKYTNSSKNSIPENKQPNQKVQKTPKSGENTFLQRRHTDG